MLCGLLDPLACRFDVLIQKRLGNIRGVERASHVERSVVMMKGGWLHMAGCIMASWHRGVDFGGMRLVVRE